MANPGFTIPDVGKIDMNKLYSGNSKKDPDFITSSNKRGRDVMGQLVLNTGSAWLGGYVGGAAFGFVEGWRGAASTNVKIRMNSVMNALSRRGGSVGNALGVIACAHTSFVWVADQVDLDGVLRTEAATPVFAGFATGLAYKSTAGVRGAVLSGLIGAAASCVYWYGGPMLYSTVFGKPRR